MSNRISPSYLRNFVFGVEDSLVSTVGLLSGLAIAQSSRESIFITGIILIFVEGFSMAAGSFLAEYTEEEYLQENAKNLQRNNVMSGVIMFLSYFVSGFIPLVPYMIFSIDHALKFSILASMLALCALGVIGGKVTKTSLWRNSTRMVMIGGMAILVGILAGMFTAGL